MPQSLYAVTARMDGNVAGAFVLASDTDEAAARASARLGANGKLTHIVHFCEARLGTLQRNGLLAHCPQNEQVEFLSRTLLDIVEAQQRQVAMLRAALESIMGTLKDRLGLRQFKFTIVERSGVAQIHECFALDIAQAEREARQLAETEYGAGAKVVNIQEANQ